MKNSTYFASLGYKWSDSQSDYIIKDFQRHAGLKDDGLIGPLTKAKMNYYNHLNFCPEVFEPIKPYIFINFYYNDVEIEALMQYKLKGLGLIFNKYAKDNDFNVLHSVAHAILESASGTSKIALKKNNIFGFGAYDLSPMASAKKFSSFAECIEIWSKWFNENYLEAWGQFYHGNCEKGVNYKYASSGIAGINKSFIVRQLRKQLGG